MTRNLIRYVDQLPGVYAVGVITMFITRQHQRLGDLAAGTLVVRDGEDEAPIRTYVREDGEKAINFLEAERARSRVGILRARTLDANAWIGRDAFDIPVRE